jgi:hypothetical protein
MDLVFGIFIVVALSISKLTMTINNANNVEVVQQVEYKSNTQSVDLSSYQIGSNLLLYKEPNAYEKFLVLLNLK